MYHFILSQNSPLVKAENVSFQVCDTQYMTNVYKIYYGTEVNVHRELLKSHEFYGIMYKRIIR